jgi:hypothetical protein
LSRDVTYLGPEADPESTSTDPEEEEEEDGEECLLEADTTREEVMGCGGGREGKWSVTGGGVGVDVEAVPYVCVFTRRDCL